jgi:hypothetical protein
MKGLIVDEKGVSVVVVPARLYPTGNEGSGAALMGCTVPAALMRGAEAEGVQMRAIGVVHNDSELCLLLLKAAGALAVLAVDACGPDALAWLSLARARGRLEVVIVQGDRIATARTHITQDIDAVLARCGQRRPASHADMGSALASFTAWLGTEESQAVLGLDLRAGHSPVVVSVYLEPSTAQRHCAAH